MPLPADGNYNNPPYETNLHCLKYENNDNLNYPNHWHSAMEIIMPIKGAYEITLKNKKYKLNENDIFLIPPFELHELKVPQGVENGKRLIFLFDPTILHSIPGLNNSISMLYSLNLITPENMGNTHKSIFKLLLSCIEDNQKHDLFNNVVVYLRIIEMFLILTRYYLNNVGEYNAKLDKQPGKRKDYVIRLSPVLDYINSHLTEKITLEMAAKVANFSKFHFDRVFKLYTNMTFYEYLKFKRIKRVESMLINPQASILDVAMGSGFGSLAAFNKAFKEIEQCTPSQYRKLFRG